MTTSLQPFIHISSGGRDAWLAAAEQSLSPEAYLESARRSVLETHVNEWSALPGVISQIDADGDLVLVVTDAQAHHRFAVSNDLTTLPDPTALADHLHHVSANRKESRAEMRALAAFARDLAANKYARLAAVPFDSLPIGRANAFAAPVPAGGDIVAINDQMAYTHVWVDWYAWRWLSLDSSPLMDPAAGSDPSALRAWQRRHRELFLATHDLASAICSSGRSAMAKISDCEPELALHRCQRRAEMYSTMMVYLAILHEFGHVALGHTDWHRERTEAIVRGYRPTMNDRRAWCSTMREQEFEADAFAALWSRAAADAASANEDSIRGRDHFIFWAAHYLFKLFHYDEYKEGVFETDPEATHPPPLERLRAFWSEGGITGTANLQDTALGNL